MQKTILAIALAAGVVTPALAEDPPAGPASPAGPHTFTANVGGVSDYLFRGISQTQGRPALQAGADYSHASGLYAGFWASNVKWTSLPAFTAKPDNHVETDFYGGYKGSLGDFGYDVGLIRYYYPGSLDRSTPGVVTPDTTEVYVGGSWKFVSLKYSQTVSDYMVAWVSPSASGKTQGSNYTDLTVTYPLNEKTNLIGHVGRQNIKNRSTASYTDWKLGATYDFGLAVVGLSYSDTNANTCGDAVPDYCWDGRDVAKGRAVLSISKTF
ncbi:MAG: hypothetical protein H6R10_1710 [Rhodocyclaceae bacterium]|nr:hypothetical protein [Rhodocyclaceae bacterium]